MPKQVSSALKRHRSTYPFTAIVGQEEMKLALVLNAVDPMLGGVLIMGHRGTGKSTAVRSLASLLPEIRVVQGCPYRCDPADYASACADCRAASDRKQKLPTRKSRVRVVDLPLGATEDRVSGTIDIERALKEGVRSFEPGLLARANRGFLYIDEVNLLDDHLVDLLLDVSVSGVNRVERESISIEHPSRFVLVGSGNPEEGELRPQLLDRFALNVEVTTENDVAQRVEVVERHEAADHDLDAFVDRFEADEARLRTRINRAQSLFPAVGVDRGVLLKIAALCSELKLDGHRGELTLTRAARALAALEGRRKVKLDDVKRVAQMSLRHRLRRQPFDEHDSGSRIDEAVEKVFVGEQNLERGRQDASDVSGNGRPASDGPNSEAATTDVASPATSHQDLPEPTSSTKKLSAASKSKTRSKRSLRNESTTQRGRYSRSTQRPSSALALDATLRAIAGSARTNGYSLRGVQVRTPALPEATASIDPDSLRYKKFTRRSGSLYILVVDTSGSMAARRIERAREVAALLLRRAYIQRDSVAVVAFRGTTAEEVLPPSRSIVRAKRALESLPIGGATPLSAGVACALELAKRAGGSSGQPTLLLFTDGGANVAQSNGAERDRTRRSGLIANELKRLGAALKKEQVPSIVVSTQNRFRHGDAQSIAEYLGADYFPG